MRRWLRNIEYYTDRSIPYALLILLVIIIFEFSFPDLVQPYIKTIHAVDNFIIFIFVVDLTFKYVRIKDFPKFFRIYWIEILAVFPVFLILRLFEELAIITELGTGTQKVIHGVVEAEKESRVLIREIERASAESSRIKNFARYFQPIARLPRFFMAFSFFDQPNRHKR